MMEGSSAAMVSIRSYSLPVGIGNELEVVMFASSSSSSSPRSIGASIDLVLVCRGTSFISSSWACCC